MIDYQITNMIYKILFRNIEITESSKCKNIFELLMFSSALCEFNLFD